MTESYESIQGEAKGAGVDEWRQVDKERAKLTALYRSLAEDDTRTNEYKVEKAREALRDHEERVGQVKEVIARGAAEMAFSTLLVTDYGLAWDEERKTWTNEAGFAYDGSEARRKA